jgi:hypothetical protein
VLKRKGKKWDGGWCPKYVLKKKGVGYVLWVSAAGHLH